QPVARAPAPCRGPAHPSGPRARSFPMRYLTRLVTGSAFVLTASAVLGGCERPPAGGKSTAPTPVTVSYPVEREVTDYEDFTGRTASPESVEVRARVWGYLQKVNFKEGMEVKKGDVLFEIDPRTYKAALDQAKAKVTYDEAQLKFNDAEYKRNK